MPARKETILVVDADPADREFVRGILESGGYNVLEAADYGEALEAHRRCRRRIHLLLTALALPSNNGYELARTLFRADPDLKALFVSGLTGAEVSPYYHMPITGSHMLNKPLNPGEVVDRVRNILHPRERSLRLGTV